MPDGMLYIFWLTSKEAGTINANRRKSISSQFLCFNCCLVLHLIAQDRLGSAGDPEVACPQVGDGACKAL